MATHGELQPLPTCAVFADTGAEQYQRAPHWPAISRWIGISVDEAVRIKPATQQFIKHRWPLIEQKMTRDDGIQWLAVHGYRVPYKSCGAFRPYHNAPFWRKLKRDDPARCQECLERDQAIRHGVPGIQVQVFRHPSGVPLAAVDFEAMEQRDGFGEEGRGYGGL